MDNRQLCDSKKISEQLIGMWLAWGLLFALIYSVVTLAVIIFVQDMIVIAVVSVILQGIFSYFAWRLSTKSVFKHFTTEYTELPNIMKNIFLFTLIVCLIIGLYHYSNVGKRIDESLLKNKDLIIAEAVLSLKSTEEEMAEYQKQKEEIIQKTKKEARLYVLIVEGGMTAAFLAVLPLERKEILKYIQ